MMQASGGKKRSMSVEQVEESCAEQAKPVSLPLPCWGRLLTGGSHTHSHM